MDLLAHTFRPQATPGFYLVAKKCEWLTASVVLRAKHDEG